MINFVCQYISYSCYNDIYGKDPLEHAEIDIKYNHFKLRWVKEQKE